MSERILEILLGVQDRKLRRDLRKARRDISAFGKDTSRRLRSSFKDSFGTLAGVGTVSGIAAIGKSVLDVDKKLTRLGIQAGQSKAEMIGFHERLRDLSDDTGLGTENLADAAARFVSLTGAYKQARRGAEVFAKASAASGASLEDVAGAAASLSNNLDISDVAGFQQGLSIMLTQGKAGAVELRELAGLLPTIAPNFTKFGRTGTDGLAELGGALQVVRRGFGSGSEAATGLNALMTSLTRNASKFEKAGVTMFNNDAETGKQSLRNFLVLIEAIGNSQLMNSPQALIDTFGSSEAERSFQELYKGFVDVNKLWRQGLASNAVEEDFATYMESSAGRIEKAWQRLQNTFAREITAERIERLVSALDALGRVAGFVVDNIKTIAVAFGAWKLAQWTRRIHTLSIALGTAGQATGALSQATQTLGAKAPTALGAVSLPMDNLAQKSGIMGTRGASSLSKFGAGLSALGNTVAVGTLAYELGTLLDKATGFSDWLVDVETRVPTASRYDPTGKASRLRIYASQANTSANSLERKLSMVGRDNMDADKLQTVEGKITTIRAEQAMLERQATTIEVLGRVQQMNAGHIANLPDSGPASAELMQSIAKATMQHTGKQTGDPELKTIMRDVLAELQRQSRRQAKLDQDARDMAASLANDVGRAPAP